MNPTKDSPEVTTVAAQAGVMNTDLLTGTGGKTTA